MARAGKINKDVLLKAGLELMRLNGKPLTKVSGKGGSMLYNLPSGETVRADLERIASQNPEIATSVDACWGKKLPVEVPAEATEPARTDRE